MQICSIPVSVSVNSDSDDTGNVEQSLIMMRHPVQES